MRGTIGLLTLGKTKSDFISGLLEGSLWEWVGFIACLFAVVVLIWLVVRVRTWLRDDAGSAADNSEMWKQLKDLKQQGHLSEEEFRSINSRMFNPEKEKLQQQDDSSSSST